MGDDKVVRLRDVADASTGETSVAAWLRAMADQVDSGELGNVQRALVIFNVATGDTEEGKGQFCCKLRRTDDMSYLEALGALHTAVHDMLHC